MLRRLTCLALPFAATLACAQAVPSGTRVEVRLQQPIRSYSTPKGTHITAVVIASVREGSSVYIPYGSTVDCTVVDVHKVGVGVVRETAEITLKFDTLHLVSGQTVPFAAHVAEVENARESINRKGNIQGVRSTSTLSHRASGVVGTLAFGNPIATVFSTAGSASVLRFSEPEITLPAGTELQLETTAALDLPVAPAAEIPALARDAAAQEQLAAIVHRLPYRTYTTGQKPVPSDLTNLAFIGTQDSIERAFEAAGWVQTDELTAQTTYSTIRSVAENQGYKAAPMSTLTLNGEEPEYAYAKTLDTFSKRHHLRIFATTETWYGEKIWTSSATHDTGIGFSKKNKTFIHLIDTRIDNERTKVVNDLIFTGCVTSVQLVTRPWLPDNAVNGTNEQLITDKRIAVLQINDCEGPVKTESPETATPAREHGNGLERTTRQTVLTLKNNILRDNIVVMSYSGIKYWVDSKKKPGPEEPARKLDVEGSKYTIDSRYEARDSYSPPPPAGEAASEPEEPDPRRWAPPSVELGLHAGFHGYYGGNGGAIALLITDVDTNDPVAIVALGNSLGNGWEIGGTVTLDPQKYLSHEFSFDQSYTAFTLGFAVVGTDSTSGDLLTAFAFDQSSLRTSQFAYDLLINATPKTSRWRPYVAVGPALQLMHLADAPITKAPSWYKLGLGNVGLLTAAWDFGGTPPLQGGGIFQVGLNYGAGLRYRITPRWMARVDWRETLTSQPDFWSKSKNDILANTTTDANATITFVGPYLNGASRQDRITGGVSFTF